MTARFLTAAATGLALAITATAIAQDQDVTIEATDLGGGVYMLVGQGGNIGISAGPDGVLMIDDQFDRLSENILARVEEITGGQELKYVLNTHYHGDHTGGNEAMTAAGGTIVAHANVRVRLASGEEPRPDEALPVITHEDGMTFFWNDNEIQIHYVPNAHTDGDSMVFIPNLNIIHTGDTLFSGRYPYIDLDGGGTVDGYIANLANIVEMADADTQIIPGHGPLSTEADVRALHDVLVEAKAAVQALVDEGLSADEIVAADPLAEWNETWAWGFINGERMTRTIVTDLMSEKAHEAMDHSAADHDH
ncbi:MBL fold metallo-hydrolase [Aquisalinus flavus]|uniref:Cyclase n=1 Tax=Aquisalinus flavus TaxID=1526572 RepID=A0A8J2V4J5_9PROT|nr:MBL fold metallo-hydrolase [Aquisalinus flavus]MBD0426922.1 MBL fold metallo-hydrolase [Aquisalinus flavus]UNE46765.1 MBL fold metallo-hydrolase [Aquisalinus flavus]GGC96999.1 cyclase [Aquisalinus flavus]